MYQGHIKLEIVRLGRIVLVVSVIVSHLCDCGSNPGQGFHIIRYALNSIQFVSDESSAELV